MGIGSDDISRRLAAEMEKAKAAKEQASAVQQTAGNDPQDAFSERLKKAGQPSATQDNENGEQPEEPGGPVGQGDYIVRSGDCVSSVANEKGYFWKTIWNEPANQEVKETRVDPNVLLPGDRLTIPDKRRKDVSVPAEARHRFKRLGEPAKFHVRLMADGEALCNQPYKVKIDHKPGPDGTTDADGNVSFPIPGKTDKIELLVGEGDNQREYVFELGEMAPLSEIRGVQQRLRALGYPIEQITDELDEPTKQALIKFQQDEALDVTGEPDEKTRARIREVFGG